MLASPRCESEEQYQTCTWFQAWKLGFCEEFVDVMPRVCSAMSGTCANRAQVVLCAMQGTLLRTFFA